MVSDTPEKRIELLQQGRQMTGKQIYYGRPNEDRKERVDVKPLRGMLVRFLLCFLVFLCMYFENQSTPWRKAVMEELSVHYLSDEQAVIACCINEWLEKLQ